ncbi:MAG: hypothetical protein VX012_02200 [Planctomycetota bacterium]|nr:hypothetical protein [Planctomycetota bacterium]
MKIIRFLLAPIVGILLILVSVTGIQAVGHQVYPPPPNISELSEQLRVATLSRDQAKVEEIKPRLDAAIAEYLPTAPLGALCFVVGGWLAGSFVSAFVAAMITPILRVPMALLMGLMVISTILIMAREIPHPGWMPIVGMAGSLVATLLAGMIVDRFTRPRAVSAS